MQKIDLDDGLDPLSNPKRFIPTHDEIPSKSISKDAEHKDDNISTKHGEKARINDFEDNAINLQIHHSISSPPSRPSRGNDERPPRSSTPNMHHHSNSQDPYSAPPTQQQQPKVYGNGLHLAEIDLFPGEIIYYCCTAQIDLIQFKNAEPFDGRFFTTNYKFSFKSSDPFVMELYGIKSDYFQIPLGLFAKIEKKADIKATNSTVVDISIKDGRVLRFKFLMKELERLTSFFQTIALPERIENFFAFDYNKIDRRLEDKYHGWKTYDIFREFKRQGMEAEPLKHMPQNSGTMELSYKFKFVDNRGGKYCSTYPPYFIIPSRVRDDVMKKCSQFRSRERLPALTYHFSSQGSCLFRSAQSKPGIYSSRCVEDEIFLQYLGNPNLKDPTATMMMGGEVNLLIIDARPYLSALANRAHGKGYENTKDYKNCEIEFMQIENIHHVRESHKKLLNLCLNPDLNTNNKWYSNLDSTEWLDMISLILNAGVKAAQNLLRGRNVLVHCSDGWDRTAEICSIAQILLDPYFRTIEGFQVLLEKDWVSFGYQSQLRHGLAKTKEKEDQKSPIMLQFLDCVHQLIQQFPFAFQFNTKFLQDISYYSHTCQFGTFLANSHLEVEQAKLPENTVSLWSFMNSKADEYFNVYYGSIDISDMPILIPKTPLKFMRVWEENYLYHSPLAQPPYKSDAGIRFMSDFATFTFSNQRTRIIDLESKLSQMATKLEEIEKDKLRILKLQKAKERKSQKNLQELEKNQEVEKSEEPKKKEGTEKEEKEEEKEEKEKEEKKEKKIPEIKEEKEEEEIDEKEIDEKEKEENEIEEQVQVQVQVQVQEQEQEQEQEQKEKEKEEEKEKREKEEKEEEEEELNSNMKSTADSNNTVRVEESS